MVSLACNLPKTTSKFHPSKFRQKNYVQTTQIFLPSQLHRKRYMKKCGYFDQFSKILICVPLGSCPIKKGLG